MRQGQQNRRGRGRGNNRKGQNPLTRSFESNGPDVKIRGTAAHVAEKYISLARDAQSSGDIVMAENYLQHAEHYNRIIMVNREQASANEGMNGHAAGPRGRQQASEQAGQGAADNETTNGERPRQPPSTGPQPREQRASEPRRRSPRRSERSASAASEAAPGTEAQPNTHESFATGDEPEFLKRPVRRKPRASSSNAEAPSSKDAPANASANDD